MSDVADVVVIGGGIMGTATAYHLAKRGVKVTLLEKEHLGAGSTGLTGGIIRQHYSVETAARLAKRAVDIWNHFDEQVGGEVGFIKTGVIFLAGTDGAALMAQNVAMQQSAGIRTELLDAKGLKALAPYLLNEDVAAASYEPDGGIADGSLACNAFAKRARDFGAVIRLGSRVTGIRVSGGRIAGVDTQNGPVKAPVVVNTAGPWGADLARKIGIEVPIEVSRHQIATFRQPADFEKPMHPVVGDFINAFYIRPDTGGLTMAGSIVDDTSDQVPDPDVYSTRVDRSFLEEMVERSARRVPALERGSVQGGWAGLYSVTPDWSPIIDHVEEFPGLVLGLGFSGSGFKMGPVLGEALADLATGDHSFPIDVSDYRLGRFSTEEWIQSDREYGFSIVG